MRSGAEYDCGPPASGSTSHPQVEPFVRIRGYLAAVLAACRNHRC